MSNKVGDNQYKQCYVWSPGKRTDFMDVQNKKEAIWLRKVKSFSESVSFNQHSLHEEVINPSLEADIETIDESTVRSIDSIDKVPPPFPPPEQIISVKAKVINIYNAESSTRSNGSSINKQKLVIGHKNSEI